MWYNLDTIKRSERSERKVVFIMLRGFTFFLNGKDYFVETSRTNKTQNLAAEILQLLGYSVTEGNIKALLFRLMKATCEVKIAENAIMLRRIKKKSSSVMQNVPLFEEMSLQMKGISIYILCFLFI